jgi:tRNA threonylcarbamoyladenosine biosynthesis protein TsaB
MRVLAIDTAMAACAAAVLDTAAGGMLASESLPMVRGHAEELMPLLQRIMKKANMTFGALDRVAVTTGPGSFTGLRVGVAAARGIALSAEKPAVGVSTLAAYAAPHIAAGASGSVVAAIDAHHGHVYLQVFGPGGQILVPARLSPLQEAVEAATQGCACIAGSAAQLVAAAFPSRAFRPAIDARAAPDIVWVAQMGAVVPETQSPPAPLYLRAPDAQPQYAARIPRR